MIIIIIGRFYTSKIDTKLYQVFNYNMDIIKSMYKMFLDLHNFKISI
jgi:hypothetical protein